MARVKFGSIVTEIRGKVGGQVFQGNGYGFSLKNSPNVTGNYSGLQQTQQRLLQTITQGWGSLDQSVRNLYNQYASDYPQYSKHNSSVSLSGFAIFTRWEQLIYMETEDFRTTFLGGSVAFPVANWSLIRSGGTLMLSANASAPELTYYAQISLSGRLSPTINYPNKNIRVIGNRAVDSASYDIAGDYNSIYGFIPESGDRLLMRIVKFVEYAPVVSKEEYIFIVVQ